VAATNPRRSLRRDPESLSPKRLVVTTGEPAGIGPDLALAAALSDWSCELVFAGDAALLASRAALLGLSLRQAEWRDDALPVPHRAGTLPVLPARLARDARPGLPDPANARYVLETIDAAARGCMEGRFAAMVTAPVQKSSINEAGIAFRGHTEYLAAIAGGAHPVMLLVAGNLRVALATTHLPLAEVTRHITRASLE
jgi:4-hydroxythreonine-4-phosphate dehydrogenase